MASVAVAEPSQAAPVAPTDDVRTQNTEEARAIGELSSDALESRLREGVTEVLQGLDLQSTTLGQVRSALEEKLGMNAGSLDEHKLIIRSLLEEKIQQLDVADATQDENPEEDEEEAQTPEPKKRKDKAMKRKRRLIQAAAHLMRKCRRTEASKEVAAAAAEPDIDLTGVEGPLKVQIGEVQVDVPLKTLYGGRRGFHATRPLTLLMGGRQVELTCMISCAITGVKEPNTSDELEQPLLGGPSDELAEPQAVQVADDEKGGENTETNDDVKPQLEELAKEDLSD